VRGGAVLVRFAIPQMLHGSNSLYITCTFCNKRSDSSSSLPAFGDTIDPMFFALWICALVFAIVVVWMYSARISKLMALTPTESRPSDNNKQGEVAELSRKNMVIASQSFCLSQVDTTGKERIQQLTQW